MANGTITKEELVESGAAKAYDELKKSAKALVVQLEALNKEVSKAKTTTTQTSTARGKSNKLITEEEKLTKQLKVAKEKLALAESKEYKELIKTKKALSDKNAELRKGEKATKSQEKASKGLTATFGKLLKSMVAFIGVRMFIDIIKQTFELVKTMDSLQFAMEKITKTAFDTKSSFRFMMELADDFGVSLVSTTERWIKFLAAAKQSGLTLLDTENIFRSMTKAASVLGLKTDELRGVYLALEQMLSKGKVTTEELRRQLGERLPGAMGIMAASLGVTISELDKMLKKGEVLSAEVLPNFAKAVEIAYGIETVEKVETLVASQNRLTSAWQLFVKNVMEDNNFIKGVFDGLGKNLEFLGQLFFTAEQKRQLKIIEIKKSYEKEVFKIAKDGFDKTLAEGQKFADIRAKIDAKSVQIAKNLLTANSDEKDLILQEELATLTKTLLDYNDNIVVIEKGFANDKIANVSRNYDLYKGIVERGEKVIADKLLENIGNGKLYQSSWLERTDNELISARKIVIANAPLLEMYTAQLEVLKKLKENSRAVKPKDEDEGSGTKKLREIQDLQNKIRIENLKKEIKSNKEIIKADETLYTEKIRLASLNASMEDRISQLSLKDALDAINKKADAEIKAAGGKGTGRGIKLELERNQKIELAQKTHKANLVSIELKHVSNIDKIQDAEIKKLKDSGSAEILELENKRNDDLLKVRTELSNDSIKLKKEELRINQEIDRKILESRILTAELSLKEIAKLDSSEEFADEIERLNALIKKLRAQLAKLGGTESVDAQATAWLEILDLASQFSDALGGLFDAISDRRIEQIDAEINAEEIKYDRLLELASDDKAQSESIQREKDAALAKLEKKRLKEEQKAAKIQKGFAIADIAMKLAQTLVANNLAAASINAATLGIGGTIFLAIQNPIAIATAALQTAAVLAAPIPQFAEGGQMSYDGKALINDGGNREYVERNGVILSSPIKNAVVDLQKGDTIHKDYNSLMNASIMTSLANDNKNLDSSRLKLIFDDNYANLENVIGKSLSKAKFNNNISLNGFDKNQELYRQEQSRWS